MLTGAAWHLRALRRALWLELCWLSGFRLTPRPLLLIFEVNDTCNSRCRYCSVWRHPAEVGQSLTEGAALDLIDQAAALGVVCMSFTGGGEPLLRADLPRLIAHAKKRGLRVALTTNGLLITEENVEQLLQADVITVSIDSLAGEAYELRRGVPGGLAKALRGVERLLAHNRRSYIVVQAVLDEENWKEVAQLNEYFYRLGVDTVYQPVYGHFFEIPPAEWQSLTRHLKFKRRLTGWLFRPFLRRLPEVAGGRAAIPCLAGSFAFVVDHRGYVKACHLDETCKVGSQSMRLREAWHALAERRRQLARTERGCLCGDTAYVPYAMALGRWRGRARRRVGGAVALRWER